jgi:hypothetical protein
VLPGLDQHGEAAVVEGLLEGELFCGDKTLPREGVGDELTDLRRQRGNVADGAGTRAGGGAEGFPNEVGVVDFVAAARFGDLDEHWLRCSALVGFCKAQNRK